MANTEINDKNSCIDIDRMAWKMCSNERKINGRSFFFGFFFVVVDGNTFSLVHRMRITCLWVHLCFVRVLAVCIYCASEWFCIFFSLVHDFTTEPRHQTDE